MMRSEKPIPRQDKLARRLQRVASFSVVALCLGAPLQAQAAAVKAVSSASVTILDRGGLYAPAAFSFEAPAGRSASAGMSAEGSSGNTQLTISGEVGDTLSITAPSSLILVRNGGDEVLTAAMRATSADEFGGQGLMTGGSVMRAGSMKVDIGCNLTDAVTAMSPGAYRGQFVVLIQYN